MSVVLYELYAALLQGGIVPDAAEWASRADIANDERITRSLMLLAQRKADLDAAKAAPAVDRIADGITQDILADTDFRQRMIALINRAFERTLTAVYQPSEEHRP